jgi:hypothetical protein
MTIWILALLLLASGFGMGLRQGAIRASFSFLGIVLAMLLAAPVGSIFKHIMPHIGISNPTMVWMLAPIEGFVVVLIIFKMAGFFVHRKADVHYKHYESDMRQVLWLRMNSRLGACVGVLNGTLYLVLVSFVIYNLSYWTAQVATSDSETKTLRLVNQFGHDLDGTGMDKAAIAVAALPENYYKLADLAGLICQNPQVSDRLGNYPPFISLLERDDLSQLAQNSDFTNAFQSHAPIGQLINQPAVQNILQNTDLVNTVWATVTNNLDDLTAYLKTGKSQKYDSEKILGNWDFNARVTLAMLREAEPNISSSQMQSTRAWMTKSYADTTFVAGSDGQAFLKNLPRLKPGKPPTTETATWKGSWTADGENYDLLLTANGANKSMSAKISNDRLTLSDEKTTLIFDR